MVNKEEWAALDRKIKSWTDWRGQKHSKLPKLACRHCGGWGHIWEDGTRLKCAYCDGTGDDPHPHA